MNPRRSRKNCLHCGRECKRPQDKYCDNTCQHDFQCHTRVAQWLAGDLEGGTSYGVRTWVKRWLIEQRGECCEICGWDERHPTTGCVPIEVDHIGGSNNHRPENLRLLCPNCHSLTPTYRALNKGKGRSYRRLQYQRLQSVNGDAPDL